ncbi:MAG TPA: glutaredoxin 3 [Malonomonas sp.]
MQAIDLYSKNYCQYCHRAKELLNIKGVNYNLIDVTTDSTLEAEMHQRSGRKTVPQIFIGGRHIGGCSDLFAMDEQGELDLLLAETTDSVCVK